MRLIDADITAFGEELARHELSCGGREPDALALLDYERALDAYERGKRAFVGDRDRDDAADVIRALQEGRHALACAAARVAGLPLPESRPPCFFDPRHGPSTAEVRWAPPGGAPRPVAVCAADAVRITEGLAPITTGLPRTVSAHPSRAGADRAYRVDPRPVPGPPPPPGRGRNARPFRAWPPGTDAGQYAQGHRDRTVELVRPDTDLPVLLVVRLHTGGGVELLSPSGRPEGPRLVKAGGSLRRTVVPLPPDRTDTVRVALKTPGAWSTWLQPLDDRLPLLMSALHSSGPYVFRYPGGPATLRIHQRQGGAFSLDALTDQGRAEERLFAGKGSLTAECRLPGPCLVHLRSTAEWRLELVRSG